MFTVSIFLFACKKDECKTELLDIASGYHKITSVVYWVKYQVEQPNGTFKEYVFRGLSTPLDFPSIGIEPTLDTSYVIIDREQNIFSVFASCSNVGDYSEEQDSPFLLDLSYFNFGYDQHKHQKNNFNDIQNGCQSAYVYSNPSIDTNVTRLDLTAGFLWGTTYNSIWPSWEEYKQGRHTLVLSFVNDQVFPFNEDQREISPSDNIGEHLIYPGEGINQVGVEYHISFE